MSLLPLESETFEHPRFHLRRDLWCHRKKMLNCTIYTWLVKEENCMESLKKIIHDCAELVSTNGQVRWSPISFITWLHNWHLVVSQNISNNLTDGSIIVKIFLDGKKKKKHFFPRMNELTPELNWLPQGDTVWTFSGHLTLESSSNAADHSCD